VQKGFSIVLAGAAAGAFAVAWTLTPPGKAAARPPPPPTASAADGAPNPHDSVYYSGCNAVRAAGAAPLYRGEPGYRPEMDGDGDGIACEPHRH
jgi:hypothetical protein